jgi:methylenetetrahydrofolate dehydrogenase (NADP+)/methenyltetrahydrofolate cyclohydrolase
VIITAAGKAGLIDLNKCFADLVIDVGINRDENGKLCGDCFNFDAEDNDSMKVATLPNGVGLITRALLLDRIRNK